MADMPVVELNVIDEVGTWAAWRSIVHRDVNTNTLKVTLRTLMTPQTYSNGRYHITQH